MTTGIDLRPISQGAHLGALLFESSPDCVKILDLDGRLLEMNRNGQCAMEVDDFAVVCGRAWQELWPDGSHAAIADALAAARAGRVGRFDAYCPTAKGTPKWWDVTVNPILDVDGQPAAILSVSRDITELHVAKEEQRETAARLRFVLDASQVGDWELDLATGVARTSLLHDRCFGYDEPVAEWNAATFMDHVHPDDRSRVVESLEQARASGRDLRFECRVVWPDGSLHWIAVVGSLYGHGLSGEDSGRMLGTVRDITHRKRVEEQLRATGEQAVMHARAAEMERRRLDALLDAAPVGILYVGADGRLLAANAGTRRIWGEHPVPHDVDEYVQWRGWWADGSERDGEPIAPQDWPAARLLAGRADRIERDVIEIEPFDAPGTRKTLLVQAAAVRDGEGTVTGAVLVEMDISDRVRAEAALRESEQRFRTITNAVPQMVWSADTRGLADYFSRQWYHFTGTDADSASSLGTGWTRLIHPDDRERAAAAWSGAVASGSPYETEYRLRHATGAYRWVLARGLPVRGDDDAIIRWMGTCTDLHEQKLFHAALQRSEEALKAADQRKDEFLAMLAHELRNPLAPISTAAQLLQKAPGDERRVRHASEIVARQVRHMSELVDDLLDVSRVTRGLVQLEREPLDLKSVVAAAIEQVRPLIESRDHVLTTWSGAAAVPVLGDRTRLVQVVANLLNNAAKYTPPGGAIDLRVEVADGEARITVRDNGTGIDAALLPNVFELFTQGERSPDRAQGGLGIGLALVESIARLHGGRVEARSPGISQGSTFVVGLPLATASPQPVMDAIDAVGSSRPLRVLAVDDNADAALMLQELLQLDGHEVLVAGEAGQALRIVEEDQSLHVFILDIGLPGMTGYELAGRIRERIGPRRARFIALTGYGQAHDRVLSMAAGFDDHLVKPVDADRLLGLLAEAGNDLAGGRGGTGAAD